MIKTVSGRFLLHVYPGETLVTEIWVEGLRFAQLTLDQIVYYIPLQLLRGGNLQVFESL